MNTATATSKEVKRGQTANGMVANDTTKNACTDLFFQIGSMRNLTESQIVAAFTTAFDSDPLNAMKILFYSRDVIMGQGERRTFRTIVSELSKTHAHSLRKNIELIPEFGRWDDVITLFGTQLEQDALSLIEKALIKDENGLCAKWMPREKSKTYPGAWKKIANKLGKNPKQYRALLKPLTEKANVVEQKMCANDWDKIEYSKVSSIAMKNNKRAFLNHDEKGFNNYVESLTKGEATVNAKAIFPHDITKQLVNASGWSASPTNLSDTEKTLLEEQWKSLPNFLKGNKSNIVVVSDVSGSMCNNGGLPMDVCIGLSLYISERNTDAFKNSVITFDDEPSFVTLKGDKLSERAIELAEIKWGGSTNLERTFRVLLEKAITHNVEKENMPDTILILSDMQFNQAVRNSSDTAFQMIEREYSEAGYDTPRVIFWNLNSHLGTNPVTFDQRGTALVSGFSPSILRNIMGGGQNMTPHSIMMDTIGEERYSSIKV